jgi:hypothetical protein
MGKDGKALYVRLPHDEGGRLTGAIFWKLINRRENASWFQDVHNVADLMGGQVPSISPTVDLLAVWGQYIAQQNPYNSFTGRNVMTDDEFAAAKKFPSIGITPMVKYTAGKLGLYGITARNVAPDGSIAERALRFTPVINRWVRYTDTGLTEEIKGVVEQDTAQQAKERLDLKSEFPEYYALKYPIQREMDALRSSPEAIAPERRGAVRRNAAIVGRIDQVMRVYRKLPDGERKTRMRATIQNMAGRLKQAREGGGR